MMNVYMRDTITVNHTPKTDWGEPGETTTEDMPARIDYVEKLVQLASGETVQSVADVNVSADADVEMDDRILLPGETGDGHRIIQITTRADFRARGMKVRIV